MGILLFPSGQVYGEMWVRCEGRDGRECADRPRVAKWFLTPFLFNRFSCFFKKLWRNNDNLDLELFMNTA